MIVKLLTERHLEFLSLKGVCTGSSESTLVKMSHCWKSHAATQIIKYAPHVYSIDMTMLIELNESGLKGLKTMIL